MNYLFSYPRSGSNFVQNVVKSSTGRRARSFGPDPILVPSDFLFFKSHAVCPDSLQDEIHRFIPGREDEVQPERMMLLWRDPRDVMISFYEWTQVHWGIDLEERDFLETYDRRRPMVGLGRLRGLTVLEAYRLFFKSWHEGTVPDVPRLALRYEQLVNDPEAEFQRIFDFLEIEATLNVASLGRMVSQVSSTRRVRGRPAVWKSEGARYKRLVELIDESLAVEIAALGYDKR